MQERKRLKSHGEPRTQVKLEHGLRVQKVVRASLSPFMGCSFHGLCFLSWCPHSFYSKFSSPPTLLLCLFYFFVTVAHTSLAACHFPCFTHYIFSICSSVLTSSIASKSLSASKRALLAGSTVGARPRGSHC